MITAFFIVTAIEVVEYLIPVLESLALIYQNRPMSNSRVEKLRVKRAQIDAQLRDAESRERTQKRKDDTRRKIIAGALALEHAERNPDSDFTKTMLGLIQTSVKTKKDRALFDLEPLPSEENPAAATDSWNRASGK